MNIQTQEAVRSLYSRVSRMRANCAKVRNAKQNPIEKAMLGGKVKAYVDVLNLIKGRYKNKVELPPRLTK